MSESISTPRLQVTGVISDDEAVETVRNALLIAGFDDGSVTIADGKEASARVDPDGRAQGPGARIRRVIERYGSEGEEHRAVAAAVEAGRSLVLVDVVDDDEKDRAARTLHEHGVRRLRYWGPWSVETLTP